MHSWWKRGAIYQIYPRSFADSNGDGVGDLAGVTAHVDHLADLGVEAVWLSPFYPSPMADFGYDVSDYCDVDPVFGTLADFDRMLAACHERGIRVVVDWVPNHSSDQHPWFVESRSSRDNPKRDWYVWRDPAPDGGPPDDTQSDFKSLGSAWQLDERTGQYYLHTFTVEQADLNWENPEVREAMFDTLRFWLDRGVDGFRIDVAHRITNAHMREVRKVIDEYDDRMIVGEVYLLDLEQVAEYVKHGDQLHMAHNFVFLKLPWDAQQFRASIDEFEELAGPAAWPAWFLTNHDHQRVATRLDHDGLGAQHQRAVLLMLYALRGTPFVFQGEELGLPDAEIPPDRVVDVDGRDPERAPIPWTASADGGWQDPWLPLVTDAVRLSVESQGKDPDSTLNLTRALARLRHETPALQDGDQRTLDAAPGVLAWMRGDNLLVAVNFTDREVPLPHAGELVLSSEPGRSGRIETLGPAEAAIVRAR